MSLQGPHVRSAPTQQSHHLGTPNVHLRNDIPKLSVATAPVPTFKGYPATPCSGSKISKPLRGPSSKKIHMTAGHARLRQTTTRAYPLNGLLSSDAGCCYSTAAEWLRTYIRVLILPVPPQDSCCRTCGSPALAPTASLRGAARPPQACRLVEQRMCLLPGAFPLRQKQAPQFT